MAEFFSDIPAYLFTLITWWVTDLTRSLIGLGLVVAVVAMAVAITVLHNRRVDDALLDRLGSATPGEPQTYLDKLAAAWIKTVEADPVDDLDTDTALAAIKAGTA